MNDSLIYCAFSAGSCTAAAFISAFVDGMTDVAHDVTDSPSSAIQWAHLDIAGVMHASSTDAYNVKGMTGGAQCLCAQTNYRTFRSSNAIFIGIRSSIEFELHN